MPKIAFLIHGWQSEPYSGWRPWLKAELEKLGWKVIVPAMPNPDYPKQEEWVGHIRHLVNMLGGPGGNFYFVGHSLGCPTVLRYIESLGDGQKVGGAVLVAGVVEYNEIAELENFFLEPFDWTKIKSGCRKFVAINSDNDPYIPLEHGQILKEELDAELVVLPKQGHFSSSEGFTELPAALEALLRIAE
ncbi:MAG: alpha/beta hydrolase [Candidatus Aenigmarchaeota archaeon]|nr:alpha/beta hydrolase [Candidatus Aenigmarchaeota archaeon]